MPIENKRSVAVRNAHLDLAPAALGAGDRCALASDNGLEEARVELHGTAAASWRREKTGTSQQSLGRTRRPGGRTAARVGGVARHVLGIIEGNQ